MKTLNGIKTSLICTASAITIACVVGYMITRGWHLLVIGICACTIGLTLKNEVVL